MTASSHKYKTLQTFIINQPFFPPTFHFWPTLDRVSNTAVPERLIIKQKNREGNKELRSVGRYAWFSAHTHINASQVWSSRNDRFSFRGQVTEQRAAEQVAQKKKKKSTAKLNRSQRHLALSARSPLLLPSSFLHLRIYSTSCSCWLEKGNSRRRKAVQHNTLYRRSLL